MTPRSPSPLIRHLTPRVRLALRWLVALVVIGALLSLVDVGAIGQRLRGTQPRLAIVGIAGLVLVQLVPAAAWRLLLRELSGISLGWSTTARRYYAAQALGTVTPANLGADAYRVLAVGDGLSRPQLAQPVVVQRLTSVAALVCLGLAGALSLPIDGLGLFALTVGIAGGTCAWLAIAVVRPPSSTGWSGAIARRLGWNADSVPNRGRVRSAIRDGLGLGLAFHAASLLLGLLLVRAVDPVTASQAGLVLAALAVARLSLAVPISPNGIGIQEGVLAILFTQLGLPPDTAVAAALLNRLALLITAGLGVASLLSPNSSGPAAIGQPSRPASRG